MTISSGDREILRALAHEQQEIAHSPAMDTLRKDWRLHGAFSPSSRPMLTIETWTFADDILPQMMRCEGEAARRIEWMLRSNMVNHTVFGDDTVVRDHIPVSCEDYFVPFGIEVNVEYIDRERLGEGAGRHFIPALGDLEEDFHKLGRSAFGLREPDEAYHRLLEDTVGDILPLKKTGRILSCSPMGNIVRIMDMQDMYLAMYDYPELFHQMMAMQTQDYLDFFDLHEAEGVLMATAEDCHLAQGSYCYNDKLPQTGEGLRSHDIWGYMDSQETSGVSCEMFAEFVMPYYKQIADRFGLLSYGCCEAIDPLWEACVSRFENLGKVSISPWCNEEYMGEQLRGRDIVYLRKPSPNFLGVGTTLDEDAVRGHLRKTALAAHGCQLEIAQRDVYLVGKNPDKVRRYVQLIRETLDAYWK